MDWVYSAIWTSVFIFMIFMEAQTAALTCIWFIPGALVSLILSFFKVEFWIQLLVFFVLGCILLILTKTVFKNKFRKKDKAQPMNAQALVGLTAVVTEHIDNIHAEGAVKINGQIWTARLVNDNEQSNPGELVVIDSIEGCKLICKKNK